MDYALDVSAVQMAAVCGSTAPPEISAILRKDDGGRLEVEFNGCTSFPVPYNFIRDSCPSSFDSRTGLRTFSISSMTGSLKAEDVGIVRGKGISKLRVEWSDGEFTELDSAWLYSKCISDRSNSGLDELQQPSTRLWGSDLSKTLPTFEYKDMCSDSLKQFEMMQSLIYKEGVVLIHSAPNRASLLTQVCDRILRGEGNLHLNLAALKGGGAGAEGGGYLGSSSMSAETGWKGRPIHSERTYYEGELGFVALMCTKQPEKGGELILVDGYSLENLMREEAPEHHATLCSALVLYSFVDHLLEYRAERTVFDLDRNGKVQTVAFDEQHRMRWEGGPLSGGKFLDAWCSVANMAYRPELVSSHLLRAGDVLVIDARRVLWGQAPWKGGAVACGIEKEYVERNQVLSRYRSVQSTEHGSEAEAVRQSRAPRARGNGAHADLNASTRSDLKLDLSTTRTEGSDDA